MAFRLYTSPASPRRRTGGMHVRIYRSGQIALNSDAYEALGKPAYVELHHDPERGAIGIKAAERPHEHARMLSPWEWGGAALSHRPFVRDHFPDDGAFPVHIPATFDGEYLVANLAERIP